MDKRREKNLDYKFLVGIHAKRSLRVGNQAARLKDLCRTCKYNDSRQIIRFATIWLPYMCLTMARTGQFTPCAS